MYVPVGPGRDVAEAGMGFCQDGVDGPRCVTKGTLMPPRNAKLLLGTKATWQPRPKPRRDLTPLRMLSKG